MIKLYNSLTQIKEEFVPIDSKNIRMYVCGATVYERPHIGNARTAVVFDMLFRLLCELYGENNVKYARNYTDIDDKIIAESERRGISISDVADKAIKEYEQDMESLNTLKPTVSPKATEYIEQIKDMIHELIFAGHAYVADGHVLFDINSFNNYGKLSRRKIDDMISGFRVKVEKYKRHPMDFILWKPSTDGIGWDSPWGFGRCGWHIECSAMARDLFGDTFDIHGGGADLLFPHHENEIAQSCCSSNVDRMANMWIHNEMLQVDGKKMSKSAGNFFTVNDLIEQGYDGLVIRLVYLMTHYSKPMNWSEAKAIEATKRLRKWHGWGHQKWQEGEIYAPVLEALKDNLNTPLALCRVDELITLAKEHRKYHNQVYPTLKLLGLNAQK